MATTVHIEGNLGQDLDERIQAGASGNLYCRFSVASTERVRRNDNWEDGDTTWFNCTAFGNTAEMMVETLHKGDPVIVDGKIKIRDYEKDGEKRQSVDVTVDKIGLDLSRAKRRSSESRQSRPYDDSTPPF